MTNLHIETVIPVNKKVFWELCYTKEYDDFQAPFLNLQTVQEIECEKQGDTVHRKVKVVPTVELPSALLWYLGQTEFHYYDYQVKDLEKELVTFRIIPPIFEDRICVKGEVKLVEIDENTCKQIMDVSIDISAWGIGSLLEGVMATNLQTASDNIPKAITEWLKQKESGRIEKQKSSEVTETKESQTQQQQQQQQQVADAGLSSYISSWWS